MIPGGSNSERLTDVLAHELLHIYTKQLNHYLTLQRLILAIERKLVDVDINEDFLTTTSTGMHLICCFMCDRK